MDQTIPANRPQGNTIGDPTTPAARAVDEFASKAHRTIDRAASGAQPTVDKIASNAHQVVDRVAVKANGAAEGLDSKLDDLQSTKNRLTDQCRNYVEDNPLKAVGIALAAGFILSRLI